MLVPVDVPGPGPLLELSTDHDGRTGIPWTHLSHFHFLVIRCAPVQPSFVLLRDWCRRSSRMVDMSFCAVPIILEFVVVALRPSIPNIGVPLEQVTVRPTLECIRHKLILHQMLAHIHKFHIQPAIMSCPATFEVTWPAVRNLIKLQCLLLNLNGGATDWNFNFSFYA